VGKNVLQLHRDAWRIGIQVETSPAATDVTSP
jgi:hypothetical protein